MKSLLFSITLYFSFPLMSGEVIYETGGVTIEKNISLDNQGPRIAIVTMVIGKSFADVVQCGTKSKRLYCQKHGYDFILGVEPNTTCNGFTTKRDRGLAWSKIPLIHRYLSDYDWIFWSDADSIIMNDEIKLEQFLDLSYDIIAAKIIRRIKRINTGEFFLQNTPWSFKLLEQTWVEGEIKKFYGYEQQVIGDILKRDDNLSHCLLYTERELNCHPNYFRKGDFIVHFFGIHGSDLIKSFNRFEKIKSGELTLKH